MHTFKAIQEMQGEVEYLGHIYYVVLEHFFSAIDHMEYHPSMHVDPNP